MRLMAALRARAGGDEGTAMISVILMGAVLTALVASLMASTLAEATRSGQGVTEASAMAATPAKAIKRSFIVYPLNKSTAGSVAPAMPKPMQRL